MLTITQHKGVRFKFSNGVILSVQWGPANYCDHYHARYHASDWDALKKSDCWASETAEIAAWVDERMTTVQLGNDRVRGWVDADVVAKVIAAAQALTRPVTNEMLSAAVMDALDSK